MQIAPDDPDVEVLVGTHEVVVINSGAGQLARNADPRPATFVTFGRA